MLSSTVRTHAKYEVGRMAGRAVRTRAYTAKYDALRLERRWAPPVLFRVTTGRVGPADFPFGAGTRWAAAVEGKSR